MFSTLVIRRSRNEYISKSVPHTYLVDVGRDLQDHGDLKIVLLCNEGFRVLF